MAHPKSASIVALVVALIIGFKNSKPAASKSSSSSSVSSSKKGHVNAQFIKRLWPLIKIVIPSWKSREVLNLVTLSVLLVARTFMSVSISDIKGKIVKTIVKQDFRKFLETVRYI
ncbi:hypothetical protein SteCoe_13859 [Stentor coeruleus]|uniref:ABC transmembrane type-1 domain-containing protein n=1 Tax=Stentor coeruleus TaxID=5963 RepID=A0A1R2C7K8_9CILI|nr:hypothetical protein SteCoe_13859 [Stentor coeruleus]